MRRARHQLLRRAAQQRQREKKRRTWLRAGAQLFFFVSMPGAFVAGFSGVKQIFLHIGAGEVLSADIFKIDGVRETYGGTVSKAILVSYLPLSKSIVEKCEDLGIYWFAPKDMASRVGHINQLPEWLDEVVARHEL